MNRHSLILSCAQTQRQDSESVCWRHIHLCDGGGQTTSWTLRATFVVLLEGWGKITTSLWMLPHSMLVTRGRGNRGLDSPATLWLDWHFLSSNKLLLSGAMGALGHDLGGLPVTACYFLSWSCQEATDVSIKIFDRSTSWAKCESIDVYKITTKGSELGLEIIKNKNSLGLLLCGLCLKLIHMCVSHHPLQGAYWQHSLDSTIIKS